MFLFHFAQATWRKIQEIGLAPVYREDKKRRMLLKTFIALPLIPELNFEIGMTAFCSKLSDQNDESLYLITLIILNQLGLETSSEDAEGWTIFYSTLEPV